MQVERKYEQWKAITESDFVTLFIKTWFTFIAVLRELNPDVNVFTEDGMPRGDKPFLNAYKEGIMPFVQKNINTDDFAQELFAMYPISMRKVMNVFPQYFFQTFFQINREFSYEEKMIDLDKDGNLKEREAVTRKQEREFLRFIKEDAHFCKYYDAIFILFNTGLRISEFCGLTKSDLDFKNKRIRVNHQLQRTSQMQYIIEKPKTESGERYVPMSDEVMACFKRILKDRVNPKVEPMVDGMTGFLFLDKNDMPMVALHWEKYFQHIREKYNSIYKVQMPPITPHVCRHTFCSNMAKSGMNPKMLQYIMGHSDISVTMNTYTHVKFQDAQEDFQKAINS